ARAPRVRRDARTTRCRDGLMLHLYALAGHPVRMPSQPGIAGAELRVVPLETGLDAVVSEGEAAATEEAVLDHARVVADLAESNDAVLPARFGSGHADESTLATAIRARNSSLQEALRRVHGCVEIGLRVLAEQSDERAGRAGSGRDYMV